MKRLRVFRAIRNSEDGFILPFVLVLFVIGVLLIAPMLGHGYTSLRATSTTEVKAEELHTADSGVEDALYWLMNEDPADGRYVESSPGVWDLGAPRDLNGTVMTVSIQDNGDDLLVTSTGVSPSGTTTVTALIQRTTVTEGGGTSVFENALTSLDGDITISGGSRIISDPREDEASDVFCGGTLYVKSSALIEGNVYAENGITLAWSTDVTGDASTPGAITQPNGQDFVEGENYAGAPDQNPPVLSDEEVAAIVADALNETEFAPFTPGPVTRTTWELKYYPEPASYYGADERMSNDMIIKTGVSITFGGSIYIADQLELNSSGQTFIFEGPVVVNGDIDLKNGNAIFRDSVWIADGGSLSLGGSATAVFEGPVRVGGLMDLGSGCDVSFASTIYVGGDFIGRGSCSIETSDSDAIYVGGNLSLNGSSSLAGGETIVVLGNVTIPGATELGDPATLPFILTPTGDFDISGSGYVSAVVYAPEADVHLSGSASLYGAIVCSSMSITGSAEIVYPSSLSERDDLPGGGGGSGGTTTTSLSVLSYEVS